MRRPILLLLAPALLAFTATSCGPSKDPVVAVIEEVVEAVRDRDAAAVGEHLADNVDADGHGKAEVLGELRRYLAAYQALDISYSDLESVKKAGSARAKFKVKMTGVPREIGGLGDFMPRSATYEFTLVLREEKGGWLITQATYTSVE